MREGGGEGGGGGGKLTEVMLGACWRDERGEGVERYGRGFGCGDRSDAIVIRDCDLWQANESQKGQ